MIDFKDHKSDLTLSGSDGAVVVRNDKIEVYVPTIDDEIVPGNDDPLNTVNTIAFLMYALDRSDWFLEFVQEVEGAYEDYRDEMQKDKVEKLGLRVIDGGKDT